MKITRSKIHHPKQARRILIFILSTAGAIVKFYSPKINFELQISLALGFLLRTFSLQIMGV